MSWVDTSTVMPRAAQALEQLEQPFSSAHVDAGEGLVEQQHVRFLREGAGEKDALLLPARQLADGTRGEIGDAELLQAGGDHAPVLGARSPQPPDAAVTPHHDDVVHADREGPVHFLALRHVADRVGPQPGSPTVDEHAAGPRREQPDEGLEQRRLPGPVRPDDRDLSAVRHAQRHMGERRCAVVGDGQVLDVEGRAVHGRRSFGR